MDFIVDIIFNNPIACAFAFAMLWIMFHIFWQRRVDSQYGITVLGGSSGVIMICKNQYTSRAEYKVGVTFDLIVNESSLMTSDKQPLPEQRRAELIETLRTWAKARRTTLEITK